MMSCTNSRTLLRQHSEYAVQKDGRELELLQAEKTAVPRDQVAPAVIKMTALL